jgi:hypothetical protein
VVPEPRFAMGPPGGFRYETKADPHPKHNPKVHWNSMVSRARQSTPRTLENFWFMDDRSGSATYSAPRVFFFRTRPPLRGSTGLVSATGRFLVSFSESSSPVVARADSPAAGGSTGEGSPGGAPSSASSLSLNTALLRESESAAAELSGAAGFAADCAASELAGASMAAGARSRHKKLDRSW